jgi:hypothetical protein
MVTTLTAIVAFLVGWLSHRLLLASEMRKANALIDDLLALSKRMRDGFKRISEAHDEADRLKAEREARAPKWARGERLDAADQPGENAGHG